jgi:class 3 adenylate cyclase
LCIEKEYKKAFDELNSELHYLLNNENKPDKFFFLVLFYFIMLIRKCNKEGIEIDDGQLSELSRFKEFDRKCSYIFEKGTGKKTTSGILLWIDMVDSTKYKEKNPETWPERMLYFYKMTSIIFENFQYKTVKYIGDEVMFFRPFDEGDEDINVKQIYDIIFNEKWYFEEINKYNPTIEDDKDNKDEDKIYVKICISVVRNVVKVFDIREGIEKKDEYDIIGKDVDASARIKGLATKKMVVVNDEFTKCLYRNRGKYDGCFKKYSWKSEFKGIDDEITYYGHQIKQP